MSRSKKWRLEWAFFLGENGRRQYNKLCKGCVHPCKQSFRAVVLSCPHYLSRRSKKCGNQSSKWAKKPSVAAFLCRGSMISHVKLLGVSAQEKRRIFTFWQAKRERRHRTSVRWRRSFFYIMSVHETKAFFQLCTFIVKRRLSDIIICRYIVSSARLVAR